MGNGARRKAPCGHLGEVIIGTYVACAKCDKKAAPKHVDPEKTEPVYLCRACHSPNTTKFKSSMDCLIWYTQLPLHIQTLPPDEGDIGCNGCGYFWTPQP